MEYIIWTMIFLMLCTISDLRSRTVNIIICIGNTVAAILVHIFCGSEDIVGLMFGVTIGCSFIALALLTREKIGIGDGFVILTVGTINANLLFVTSIIWSFLLSFVVSVVIIIIKKYDLKEEIPFVPYLLIGYTVAVVMKMMV